MSRILYLRESPWAAHSKNDTVGVYFETLGRVCSDFSAKGHLASVDTGPTLPYRAPFRTLKTPIKGVGLASKSSPIRNKE